MTTRPRLDAVLTLAHAIYSGKGTYAVLLGSGVSRSARIPTGWDVTLELARRIAVLEGEDAGANPAEWYTAKYGAEPDYSQLLERLAPTTAERRRLLQEFFEPSAQEREEGAKLPTRAHRAVARLVARGLVRVILTTNFDRLMETALKDEGVEPTVISTPDAAEGAAPLVHQRCVLVKLHGDYLDERVKNTEPELSSYDPRMDAYLDRVLDEFGVIACGWSGEWDPALRAAFERCKSRRYSTWWASVGTPGPRATKLITLRGAEVIRIAGADEFFDSVEQKTESLEALQSPAPLSVATAVAAVKRYIAEDRYRVRFEDLLLEEVNQFRRGRRGRFPLGGGPTPTESLVAARVRAMDSDTEILRSVFFHACRLASPAQFPPLTRALSLLAPTERPEGMAWTIWTSLAAYPMSAVLYAGCLGALAAENWELLRVLTTLRFRQDDRERVSCDDLSATRALSDAAGALFPGQRKHTPASDHYAQLLVPLADGVSIDPDLLFDGVEVVMALAYLDTVRDLSSPPIWMPPGRFSWRGRGGSGDRQLGILLAEAEAAGDAWKALRAGWFSGKAARFQEVKGAFQQAYARVAAGLW